MKSLLLCVCLVAGLTRVMADPYSTELAMLMRAIQSSAARLTILDERVGAIESAASQLSSSLTTIESTMVAAAQTTNNGQDNRIDNAFDNVQRRLRDISSTNMDLTENEFYTKISLENLRAAEDEISRLEELSTELRTDVVGLESASEQYQDKVNANRDQKNSISEAANDAAGLKINGTIQLFETKTCTQDSTNVNVSTGQGTSTVSFPSDFFDVFGSSATPTLYCAITAVQSEINEKQSQVYGYGYHPSDREESGFDVTCVISQSDSNSVDVIVTDRSMSERGLDKTIEVSVDINICTFTARGDFSL